MQDRRYQYHVFLSHNHVQKPWVRELAVGLRDAGLSVFFDDDSIELGEDIIAAIEGAIRRSRHVMLVLSPDAVRSPWVALEISTSLYRDPNAAARTIIPVLREDCECPLTIARLKYLDARTDNLSSQLKLLIRAIDRVPIETQPAESLKSASKAVVQNNPPKALFQIGGTVGLDRVYIKRHADRHLNEILSESNSVCTIWGSRQMGKSSMLVRAIMIARNNGLRAAMIDVSILAGKSFPEVLFSVAKQIAKQIEGAEPIEGKFRDDQGTSAFVCYVLSCGPRFLLAFDEWDYLRSIGALEKFSQLIRYLLQISTMEQEADTRLLISSFLSPRHFVDNRNISPFNLGETIRLENFTVNEAQELLTLSNEQLDPVELKMLVEFTGGHPYLTHVAAKRLSEGIPVSQIIQSAGDRDGPFAMHFEMLRSAIAQSEAASMALKAYIAGRSVRKLNDGLEYLRELNIFNRGGEVRFTCGAYKIFFHGETHPRLLKRFVTAFRW